MLNRLVGLIRSFAPSIGESAPRERIYDGVTDCSPCCSNCPVVEVIGDRVEIYDPALPMRGKTWMTKDQYNALIIGARQIP